MNKLAIIFGDLGYIGTNLLQFLIAKNVFDKYFIFDIRPLLWFEYYVEKEIIDYKEIDVRRAIKSVINNFEESNSWIFNFTAIHREMSHWYKEYFDTNNSGAENINKFARYTNVKNIFFKSSIAPYGWSLKQRAEASTLYLETAYGISKPFAETILKKWMAEDTTKRLVIVRPSVIFGSKYLGNVYRMFITLKKGAFILPNGGNVIKGCGHIYGLVKSMLFTINKSERFILYNYVENPVESLSKMVLIAKEYFNIKKLALKLPVSILAVITFFVQILFKLIGKTSDIHPVRVRKVGFPTNTKLQYLIDEGFGFKRTLENWNSIPLDVFK